MLNKESGMLGLTGKSDMREISEAALRTEKSPMYDAEETHRCLLAKDIFVKEVCEAVGKMYVVLGRVDMIAFSGGIGENSPYIREKIIEQFAYRGWKISERTNQMNGVRYIGDTNSEENFDSDPDNVYHASEVSGRGGLITD